MYEKCFVYFRTVDNTVPSNLWDRLEHFTDGDCSVMQLKNDVLLWSSADCNDTHSAICPMSEEVKMSTLHAAQDQFSTENWKHFSTPSNGI